ncbi:MAG: VWA domain-containing protein, partial [Candidatus Cloacimonadota bacterium]
MFHILHPLYLFGLSLASFPLILHLLGRRRIREHPFSSLFLLKEIKKSSSVWMRIKELILLLLRMLFIIFIVTAFSHPLVLSPLPFLGKAAPKEIAMLIDVSMSMGTEDALNQAKQEAMRIFKTLGRGNRTTIISFSDRIEEEKEIVDESVLRSFLETLTVTYRGTDITPALEMAEKTLGKENAFTKELFIISDFQKTGLENIESVFSRIKKNGIHIYASIIERSDKNIYFSNWSIEPPFPLPGLHLKLYPQVALTENGSYPVELF